MRMLKSRGGLAHGRGVTPSTQSKIVHIIPQTVPICESLEVFSGVHSNTYQHNDLRPTSTACDGIHYTRFEDYLAQHSPFIYKGEYIDRLVCIFTGIVAPATANADGAIELGELAANQLTGKNYTDVQLKRNDKVASIDVATNGAEVRGCQAEIAFLGNHKNKSRVIFALIIIASLTHSDIKCPQSQADADFLICNSAIELAEESDCPFILVGKDTDLLVMLIDRSCPNLYMQYSNNTIYSTDSIRDALPSHVRDYLLVAHAITGCDIVI